jgi:hypothetical protein
MNCGPLAAAEQQARGANVIAHSRDHLTRIPIGTAGTAQIHSPRPLILRNYFRNPWGFHLFPARGTVGVSVSTAFSVRGVEHSATDERRHTNFCKLVPQRGFEYAH